MSHKDLEGIVACVTGASSGIGLATADGLQARGARVAGLDVTEGPSGEGRMAVTADVTDQASLDAAIELVAGDWGGVDVLINNAGIGAVGSVESGALDEWRRVLDVNLLGIVRASRAALPHLRRSERASIVNVASIAAWAGLPERACYSASKGAILALTLAMAADHLADGIRVNCVCPGTADTPWVGRLLDAAPDPAERRAALEARQPLGRLGTADEIAASIIFLAGPGATFITGTALPVDGGMFGLRVPPRPIGGAT